MKLPKIKRTSPDTEYKALMQLIGILNTQIVLLDESSKSKFYKVIVHDLKRKASLFKKEAERVADTLYRLSVSDPENSAELNICYTDMDRATEFIALLVLELSAEDYIGFIEHTIRTYPPAAALFEIEDMEEGENGK